MNNQLGETTSFKLSEEAQAESNLLGSRDVSFSRADSITSDDETRFIPGAIQRGSLAREGAGVAGELGLGLVRGSYRIGAGIVKTAEAGLDLITGDKRNDAKIAFDRFESMNQGTFLGRVRDQSKAEWLAGQVGEQLPIMGMSIGGAVAGRSFAALAKLEAAGTKIAVTTGQMSAYSAWRYGDVLEEIRGASNGMMSRGTEYALAFLSTGTESILEQLVGPEAQIGRGVVNRAIAKSGISEKLARLTAEASGKNIIGGWAKGVGYEALTESLQSLSSSVYNDLASGPGMQIGKDEFVQAFTEGIMAIPVAAIFGGVAGFYEYKSKSGFLKKYSEMKSAEELAIARDGEGAVARLDNALFKVRDEMASGIGDEGADAVTYVMRNVALNWAAKTGNAPAAYVEDFKTLFTGTNLNQDQIQKLRSITDTNERAQWMRDNVDGFREMEQGVDEQFRADGLTKQFDIEIAEYRKVLGKEFGAEFDQVPEGEQSDEYMEGVGMVGDIGTVEEVTALTDIRVAHGDITQEQADDIVSGFVDGKVVEETVSSITGKQRADTARANALVRLQRLRQLAAEEAGILYDAELTPAGRRGTGMQKIRRSTTLRAGSSMFESLIDNKDTSWIEPDTMRNMLVEIIQVNHPSISKAKATEIVADIPDLSSTSSKRSMLESAFISEMARTDEWQHTYNEAEVQRAIKYSAEVSEEWRAMLLKDTKIRQASDLLATIAGHRYFEEEQQERMESIKRRRVAALLQSNEAKKRRAEIRKAFESEDQTLEWVDKMIDDIANEMATTDLYLDPDGSVDAEVLMEEIQREIDDARRERNHDRMNELRALQNSLGNVQAEIDMANYAETRRQAEVEARADRQKRLDVNMALRQIPGQESSGDEEVFAIYERNDAGRRVAVFFQNATEEDVIHEWFHHVDMAGLLPTDIREALDKAYGVNPGSTERELWLAREYAARDFLVSLRASVNKEPSDDETPEQKKAFAYLRKVFGATFEMHASQPFGVATEQESSGVIGEEVDLSDTHDKVYRWSKFGTGSNLETPYLPDEMKTLFELLGARTLGSKQLGDGVYVSRSPDAWKGYSDRGNGDLIFDTLQERSSSDEMLKDLALFFKDKKNIASVESFLYENPVYQGDSKVYKKRFVDPTIAKLLTATSVKDVISAMNVVSQAFLKNSNKYAKEAEARREQFWYKKGSSTEVDYAGDIQEVSGDVENILDNEILVKDTSNLLHIDGTPFSPATKKETAQADNNSDPRQESSTGGSVEYKPETRDFFMEAFKDVKPEEIHKLIGQAIANANFDSVPGKSARVFQMESAVFSKVTDEAVKGKLWNAGHVSVAGMDGHESFKAIIAEMLGEKLDTKEAWEKLTLEQKREVASIATERKNVTNQSKFFPAQYTDAISQARFGMSFDELGKTPEGVAHQKQIIGELKRTNDASAKAQLRKYKKVEEREGAVRDIVSKFAALAGLHTGSIDESRRAMSDEPGLKERANYIAESMKRNKISFGNFLDQDFSSMYAYIRMLDDGDPEGVFAEHIGSLLHGMNQDHARADDQTAKLMKDAELRHGPIPQAVDWKQKRGFGKENIELTTSEAIALYLATNRGKDKKGKQVVIASNGHRYGNDIDSVIRDVNLFVEGAGKYKYSVFYKEGAFEGDYKFDRKSSTPKAGYKKTNPAKNFVNVWRDVSKEIHALTDKVYFEQTGTHLEYSENYFPFYRMDGLPAGRDMLSDLFTVDVVARNRKAKELFGSQYGEDVTFDQLQDPDKKTIMDTETGHAEAGRFRRKPNTRGDQTGALKSQTAIAGGELMMDAAGVIERYRIQMDIYRSKAGALSILNGVLSDATFRTVMENRFGIEHSRQVIRTLTAFAEREKFPFGRVDALTKFDMSVKQVRSAAVMSALATKIPSMLRQTVSGIQSLGEIDPRYIPKYIGNFWSMIGQVSQSPARVVDTISGRYNPFQYEGPGRHAWDLMIKYSPEITKRYGSPDLQDMHHATYSRGFVGDISIGRHNAAELLMGGFRMMDLATVTAVYSTAFESKMNELRQQNPNATDESLEKKAGKFAGEVVEKTQPASGVTDRNLTQTGSELKRAMFVFTGQLMKNFQYIRGDIIAPISRGWERDGFNGAMDAFTKGEYGQRPVAQKAFFSLVLPAVMLGLIARRRLPENEEELFQDLIGYNLSAMPLVGPIIGSSVVSDWRGADGSQIYFKAIEAFADVAHDIAHRDVGERTAKSMIEGLSVGSGFPTATLNAFWEVYDTYTVPEHDFSAMKMMSMGVQALEEDN